MASPGLSSEDSQSQSARTQLLSDLHFLVDDTEFNAGILLKGFDLSLDDCDVIELPEPSFPKLPEPSLSEHPTAPELSNSFTDLPQSRSQNPFLSTPLRLKHFSRLSPSILRDLLRSPSLRSSLYDDSLDSDSRIYGNLSEDDLQSRQPSLPLTPPPSGRIKPLPQLPDTNHGKHLWSSVSENMAHTPSFLLAVIDIGLPTTGHLAAIQPNSMVSAATVRNFQRVIDEMKGVDSGHLEWNLEENEYENTDFPLASPMSSPAGAFFSPEIEARDLPASVNENDSWTMNRTLGALEQEFVGLLQQQATGEEADARELRVLADRLERIGRGRRHLVSLITERKNQ